MNPFKSLFEWLRPSDNRAAERHAAPSLAAYYWDGDRPKGHTVQDISSTGLYLVTDERWYPRTRVRMSLQNTDFGNESPQRSIVVEAMVVRWGTDGVGLTFTSSESGDSNGSFTDKKMLEKFLTQTSSTKVKAVIEDIQVAP